MIGSLCGTVKDISGNEILIDVNGVGYLVRCSRSCLAGLKLNEASVITVATEVREDAISLYGFANVTERRVFSLLTSVKGIGARSACDILSQVDAAELLRAIGREDIAFLASLRGVGRRTAERILVELRERVRLFGEVGSSAVVKGEQAQEACEALCALGFAPREAGAAVERVLQAGSSVKSTGEIVRLALQYV